MKKAIVAVFAAILVFSAGAGVLEAKKLPPKLLVGFEKDSDIKDVYKENNGEKNYPVEKVTENATEGKYACKVTFPKDGDWPGLHFRKFDGNWADYDVLKIDVFNPTKEIVALNIGIADKDSKITAENYFGEYNQRYHGATILKPGKNTFEVELAGAGVEDKSRALELSAVKVFAIFVTSRPEGFVLFMDNIRLEQIED